MPSNNHCEQTRLEFIHIFSFSFDPWKSTVASNIVKIHCMLVATLSKPTSKLGLRSANCQMMIIVLIVVCAWCLFTQPLFGRGEEKKLTRRIKQWVYTENTMTIMVVKWISNKRRSEEWKIEAQNKPTFFLIRIRMYAFHFFEEKKTTERMKLKLKHCNGSQ